jgi:hypothetical protein
LNFPETVSFSALLVALKSSPAGRLQDARYCVTELAKTQPLF